MKIKPNWKEEVKATRKREKKGKVRKFDAMIEKRVTIVR